MFLTDGKNEGEKPQAVAEELARCAGVFECDCWGVGTDWQVGEVQQIAAGLLGKASLIPEPHGVDAAFHAAIERARGKALKDVRLRLWTPQGASVIFVKQVSPAIDSLTARAKVVSPQVLEYLTGSWAGSEARDFHVAIDVRPGLVGDELLAARPSLVYLESASDAPGGWIEREEKPAAGRVFATWTDDRTLSSRRDDHLVHYAGQDEARRGHPPRVDPASAGRRARSDQALRASGAAGARLEQRRGDAAARAGGRGPRSRPPGRCG